CRARSSRRCARSPRGPGARGCSARRRARFDTGEVGFLPLTDDRNTVSMQETNERAASAAETHTMSTTDTHKLLRPSFHDDALAEARSLIGMPIRVELWNHEASRDSIRHYAWGIGDDNPLWCD